MAKSLKQVEKNVQASFGYVKKDLLMLNDSVSDIHDKIQHLSLNHATLLGEIERLRKKIEGKQISKTAKKILKKEKIAKPKTVKNPTSKKTKKTAKKTPKKVVKETITYS